MKTPHHRYNNDVMGMPCFAAEEKLVINVSAESMAGAVAQDDENCAIALGCKAQLQSPYVSVGRSRTDVALPHPQGVVKPGFGSTLWAVIRFKNSRGAREVIVQADTGTLNPEGAMIELLKPLKFSLPELKKTQNVKYKSKKQKEASRDTSDELTDMGVRILTGQRRR